MNSKNIVDVKIEPESTFRLLSFTGVANGQPLVPAFNFDIIRKRKITIKSFRIIPYYNAAEGAATPVDIFLDENPPATPIIEVLPFGARINRIFDIGLGSSISFKINGYPILFDSSGAASNAYPIDLWEDGINFQYPASVQSIEIIVDGNIVQNLQTAEEEKPQIKVLIGCYLD